MNKTVLITGASRGIGKAAAIAFGEAGYNVAVNFNASGEKAEQLVKELQENGVNSFAFKANVADREEVNVMVNEVISTFGKLDILINNAAIAQQKLFTEITEDDWDTMFNVNIKGMFNVTQAVVSNMIHHHQGKIINISSMWGITGASCEVHYSAAKGAVIAFTKALAKELGPSQIQVNCIAPGVIDTEMNSNLDVQTKDILIEETPLGRLGTPQDIA
ncbi:MAG: SDR family NAD(P)-dependent oxidoreductase, partial [Oscillospiraceae bacterium]